MKGSITNWPQSCGFFRSHAPSIGGGRLIWIKWINFLPPFNPLEHFVENAILATPETMRVTAFQRNFAPSDSGRWSPPSLNRQCGIRNVNKTAEGWGEGGCRTQLRRRTTPNDSLRVCGDCCDMIYVCVSSTCLPSAPLASNPPPPLAVSTEI
jgi:hypothetical protein